MGNVERVDKTLAINDLVYYVRKDPLLRDRWVNDLEALTREFGCTREEYEALKGEPDPNRLMDMGVHQYLVPHILRLTYGTGNMTNSHRALTTYQNAFPKESKEVLGNTKWEINNEGGNSG